MRMRENVSPAVEDYLKTIYALAADDGRAATNQIAERMDVTPASVTGMIQKMAAAEPPLVEYQKHRGVALTTAGKNIALEIIRHHRLLELFLHETLGYTWDEVHGEADRLEHVISEDFEERIAQALGDPAHDPHGDPIPTRDFLLPPTSNLQLADLRPGSQVVVQRVENVEASLLRHLSEIGMVPGARLKVLEYSPYDENLKLDIEGRADPVVLGPCITCQIYVERENVP